MINTFKAVILLILLPFLVLAQDFPLNPLSSSDWNTSKGKWNVAGDLSIHPFNNQVAAESGNSVYYSSSVAELQTAQSFGDLKFEFEMLQSAQTEATLNLGNGFVINLNNTYDGKKPYLGSVVGSTNALQNVCKATGLWQKVELTFIQGKAGNPAILERLVINGITIHQNVMKWGLEAKTAPIKINLSKGTIAIRNAAVLGYGERKPVSISHISYSLQETESWQTDFAFTQKEPIKGTSEVLTAKIPNDFRHFDLVSKGEMDVAETGDYAFTLDYQGVADLKIDGKSVVGSPEIIFRNPSTGLINLTKGKHSFEYHYKRIWWPAGLGLFVSGPDFRPYRLHDASSLPDPQITGGIFVEPTAEKASLLRSFMMFGDEKRTQVISVGSPSARHFSFDLGTGSILYGWKGEFADVTEMWYERGEPQILKPLGQTVMFSGKPAFEIDGKSSDLKLDEYYLDKAGIPTFNFLLNGQLVSQKLIPTSQGISVEVGSENSSAQYLIASASDIIEVDKGLYKTDNYYIKVPADVSVSRKEVDGKTELRALANKLESFEIIW